MPKRILTKEATFPSVPRVLVGPKDIVDYLNRLIRAMQIDHRRTADRIEEITDCGPEVQRPTPAGRGRFYYVVDHERLEYDAALGTATARWAPITIQAGTQSTGPNGELTIALETPSTCAPVVVATPKCDPADGEWVSVWVDALNLVGSVYVSVTLKARLMTWTGVEVASTAWEGSVAFHVRSYPDVVA